MKNILTHLPVYLQQSSQKTSGQGFDLPSLRLHASRNPHRVAKLSDPDKYQRATRPLTHIPLISTLQTIRHISIPPDQSIRF